MAALVLISRAIYSPSVYAPYLIKPAHPLGVYAPGTMPEQGHPAAAFPRHVTYRDGSDGERDGGKRSSELERADLEMLKRPGDGVEESAAVIEDSDC
jgi:hypothetical protein